MEGLVCETSDLEGSNKTIVDVYKSVPDIGKNSRSMLRASSIVGGPYQCFCPGGPHWLSVALSGLFPQFDLHTVSYSHKRQILSYLRKSVIRYCPF
ncbi:hypothetical protein J6590_052476 [Homalodisca vitripennis]|nr:hypothetical protein J6590_052476 [Homalodisca vitripennis]